MNQHITSDFEGATLQTLFFLDKPAWICRHVGAMLGYARSGNRLTDLILDQWRQDFMPGLHYEIMAGEDLRALRALYAGSGLPIPRHPMARVLLLFEPGLHAVAARSTKPKAERLYRFVAEHIMPCFDHEVAAPRAAPPTTEDRPPLNLDAQRERRLGSRLDLDERKLSAASLRRTLEVLHRLGFISDQVFAIFEVAACEISLGMDLPVLQELAATPRPPRAA